MTTPELADPLSPAMQTQNFNALSGRAMVPRPGRTSAAMRRYHVASLRQDGSIWESHHVAPASPVFEAAFSAFAHGTLLATPKGPTAVQDLAPGMDVTSQSGDACRITWIGSITIMPRQDPVDTSGPRGLFRVIPDAFGVGRPAGNLLMGPGARLLTRPQTLRDALSHDPVFTPCSDLVDGINVIDVAPPRPVTVFHLVLERHSILLADGIETESYHPGAGFERMMDAQTRQIFLSLFPHLRSPEGFGELACARLPLRGV
ncbi:MAG: Hint domain-containing protein [Pseudomonadota bacterium]